MKLFYILMRRLGMRKRVCIVTYYDRNYQKIGEFCEESIKKYAKMWKIDCKVAKGKNNIKRPASWMRIGIVLDLFEKRYDYVFWMDADSLFVDYSKNIIDEIDDKYNLYVVRHDIDGLKVPNLGVFLIKNCTWSKDLLGKMWSMEKYINHKWWENAAFLKLIGSNSLLDEGEDSPNEHFLSKIKWLDLAWNSLPTLVQSPKPIINHYPGVSFDKRIEYMREDLKMLNCHKY